VTGIAASAFSCVIVSIVRTKCLDRENQRDKKIIKKG